MTNSTAFFNIKCILTILNNKNNRIYPRLCSTPHSTCISIHCSNYTWIPSNVKPKRVACKTILMCTCVRSDWEHQVMVCIDTCKRIWQLNETFSSKNRHDCFVRFEKNILIGRFTRFKNTLFFIRKDFWEQSWNCNVWPINKIIIPYIEWLHEKLFTSKFEVKICPMFFREA